MDDTESRLRLQNCLQKFIDRVEELKNEDDPTGDGFTREFKVGVVSKRFVVIIFLTAVR